MKSKKSLWAFKFLALLVFTITVCAFMTDRAIAVSTTEVTNGQKIIYEYHSESDSLEFKVSNNRYCEVVKKNMAMNGSQYIYYLHVFPKLSTSLSSNTIVEVFDTNSNSTVDTLVFHVTPPNESYSTTRGNDITLNFTVYKPYESGDSLTKGPVKEVSINGVPLYQIKSLRLINSPTDDYDGVGGVFKYEYEAVINVEATGQFDNLYLMTPEGFVLKKFSLTVNGALSTIEMQKGEKLVYEYCSSYSGLEFNVGDSSYCEVVHKNTAVDGSCFVYYLHVFPKTTTSVSNNTTVGVYNPKSGANVDVLIFHITPPKNCITVSRGEEYKFNFKVYKPYEAGDTSGTGPVAGIKIGGNSLRTYKSFELTNDPASDYDGVGGVFTYEYEAVIQFDTPGQYNDIYLMTSDGCVLQTIDLTVVPTKKNIDLEVGDTPQELYSYIGSNITFVSESENIAKAVVLRKTSISGDLYSYQIGFIGLQSEASTVIRAYDPNTNSYLDTFNINVNTYTYDRSICVNHDGYLGLCMGGNDTTPRIEVAGPGSASARVSSIRELKPFESNYSIEDISCYIRYMYGKFSTVGNYKVRVYDSKSNKLDCVINVEVKEHALSNSTIIKQPNCAEVGIIRRTCSVCDDVIDETIPKTEHTYDTEYSVDVQPTCTENGSKSIHCLVCNAIDETTESITIPALGHDWDNGQITTESTCTREGVMTFTCNRCGDTRTERIEATGHVFSKEYIVDQEPSCTQEGSKSRHCQYCDEITDVTSVPVAGHSFSEEFTIDQEPSCTQEGSKSKHCDNCDEVTEVTAIPVLDHNFGDWVDVIPSTCENDGLRQRLCAACGYTESENLDPNGHDWEDDYTVDLEPTCIDDGSQSIHCKNCEAVKDSQIIPANGHSYGVWTIERDATAYEEGLKERTCSDCGSVESKEIPKTAMEICETEITGIKDAVFTGKPITQKITVKYGSTVYKEGVDYTVQYTNNKYPDLGIVTITGKGRLIGTTDVFFKIKRVSINSTAVKQSTYTYTGKIIFPTLLYKGVTMRRNGDYYIEGWASSDCNVGSHTYTCIGDFGSDAALYGKRKVVVKIIPKGTTISSVKGAKKALTVKWKKQSQRMKDDRISGYQIQYSTNKTFKTGAKTVTVKGYNKTSKKISKLKSKKNYYVRIRTYMKVGKKNYYSTWSKTKVVRIK